MSNEHGAHIGTGRARPKQVMPTFLTRNVRDFSLKHPRPLTDLYNDVMNEMDDAFERGLEVQP